MYVICWIGFIRGHGPEACETENEPRPNAKSITEQANKYVNKMPYSSILLLLLRKWGSWGHLMLKDPVDTD